MPHIIIDGYNLIRQSFRWGMLDAQDMRAGREALLEDLAAYKKKKAFRITVVFDGAKAPGFFPKNDRIHGITVTFSHAGESADDVIKRMAETLREGALVVSSDRDVASFASRQGAGVIGSVEFERRVLGGSIDSGAEESDSGWAVTTKKKGPGRRLPKRERRTLSHLKKL